MTDQFKSRARAQSTGREGVMQMKTSRILAGLAALMGIMPTASFSAPSSIGPTGLLNVPTAEVVPAGQTEVMVAYDRLQVADVRINVLPIVNAEYGFKNGEIGVAYFNVRGYTAVKAFNAKYVLTPGRDKAPAVAAGIIHLRGNTAETDLYLVATQRLGRSNKVRVTGGLLYQNPSHISGSNFTGMMGLELGKPGKTTLGFDYVIKDIAAGKLYGAILRQPITRDITFQIGIGNHSRFFTGVVAQFGDK